VSNANNKLPGQRLLQPQWAANQVRASLKRRQRQEHLFRWLGRGSIFIGAGFVVLLLFSIGRTGIGGFFHTYLKLDVDLSAQSLSLPQDVTAEQLGQGDYRGLIRTSVRELFPEISGRRNQRELTKLISNGAEFDLRDQLNDPKELIGPTVIWVPVDDDIHTFLKGPIGLEGEVGKRGRVSAQQQGWLRELDQQNRLERRLNMRFFTSGDSRDPEMAGIGGAAVGSALTLLITFLLSFPLGVATAVYLEEFAPKNRWTDLIEININNLAAVPSIIFGLLGLAVFLNFFGLPRSAPLVGGLVLSLMTMPTIIIATRAALRAVPPSIREAALGMGASRMQTVTHHVLPLAVPGIMTGSIIGMAQALGETAPLLMIGMVAFIVEIPGGITDPATTLPVQIFLWADSPERAFVEKTSAAILVLLGVLATMNLAAVLLRKKLERRW